MLFGQVFGKQLFFI